MPLFVCYKLQPQLTVRERDEKKNLLKLIKKFSWSSGLEGESLQWTFTTNNSEIWLQNIFTTHSYVRWMRTMLRISRSIWVLTGMSFDKQEKNHKQSICNRFFPLDPIHFVSLIFLLSALLLCRSFSMEIMTILWENITPPLHQQHKEEEICFIHKFFDKLYFLTSLGAIMLSMSLPENFVISSPAIFIQQACHCFFWCWKDPMPLSYVLLWHKRTSKKKMCSFPVIILSIFCYRTSSGIEVN